MFTLFQNIRPIWRKKSNVNAFYLVQYLAEDISAKTVIAVAAFVYSSFLFAQSPANGSQNELTLQKAKAIALSNDDWLIKSELMQSRLEKLSTGASALPDPSVNLGFLNLPTNGFAIDQEPMTQLTVGATQMFPRGDSLALEEKKLLLSAKEQPYLRADRRLKVALQITHLWLDAFEASSSYHLVDQARPLFDKLSDIVSASYASSSAKANQQDIIRSELELLKLNDRLVSLDTSKRSALSQLAKFLSSSNGAPNYVNAYSNQLTLPGDLPEINSKKITQLAVIDNADEQTLYRLIESHPLMDATEQRIRVSNVDIELAEQAYKPQYSLSASYALRDDSPNGQSRADFVSIGASVSVPLFSKTRQDAAVAATKLMNETIHTEKRLIMRELMSGLSRAYQEYSGLYQRYAIYQDTILPQTKQQTEAALKAYTNDTGDFAEVVRAKIAQLDAQLTLLSIIVSKRKALSSIDYFFQGASDTYEFKDTSLDSTDVISHKDITHD